MAAQIIEFRGTHHVMPEAGFSSQDRDTLTTIRVQLGYVIENVQQAMARIVRLEETRLTRRDLEELMADTEELRKEKKELADRVEVRLTALEQWMWKASGAAMVVGLLSGYLARLIFK